MTSPPLLVAVALFALLVGASLPVLYQFYQTLKRARALLDTAGPHLERTLDQVGQAAHRLDQIGSRLEAPARALRPMVAAATMFSESIGRSGTWLRSAAAIGGALAPAVMAGVGAFFSRDDPPGETMHLGSAPTAEAAAPAINRQTSSNREIA